MQAQKNGLPGGDARLIELVVAAGNDFPSDPEAITGGCGSQWMGLDVFNWKGASS
jgi:hypothetical protein